MQISLNEFCNNSSFLGPWNLCQVCVAAFPKGVTSSCCRRWGLRCHVVIKDGTRFLLPESNNCFFLAGLALKSKFISFRIFSGLCDPPFSCKCLYMHTQALWPHQANTVHTYNICINHVIVFFLKFDQAWVSLLIITSADRDVKLAHSSCINYVKALRTQNISFNILCARAITFELFLTFN